MLDIQEIIQRFKEKPYLRKMSSKNIAKRLHKNYRDVVKARKTLYKKSNKPLKVLIFDLETSPMQAYIWGRWNQNIPLDATISEWFIICWSAKWLYSNEVMGDVLTPEEIVKEDDCRIVKSLWSIINEADIVVAHNGNRADIPWMNTRFVINGLMPPKPYFSVDTCLVARKQFNFSSNKLDALATYFGLANKMDTNFELWKKCLHGDPVSLKYMLEYNRMDVKILEEVYLKLRPWIKNHPNIGNLLSSRQHLCSKCGSEHLEKIEGEYYFTSVSKYELFRCKECGSISRGRNNLNKNTNKITTVEK